MTMHFLTFVFIPKDSDIKSAVANALRPFGDEFEVKPWKRYLHPEEIARMAKSYGVQKNNLRVLAQRVEDWNGGTGGVDAKGLFAIHTFNPDAKWDWYEIGGRWSVLPGHTMTARSLRRSPKLKEILPHDFVTPDGEWHEVERFKRQGWMGGTFVRKYDTRWLKELNMALATFPDHLVVSVDRHC